MTKVYFDVVKHGKSRWVLRVVREDKHNIIMSGPKFRSRCKAEEWASRMNLAAKPV